MGRKIYKTEPKRYFFLSPHPCSPNPSLSTYPVRCRHPVEAVGVGGDVASAGDLVGDVRCPPARLSGESPFSSAARWVFWGFFLLFFGGSSPILMGSFLGLLRLWWVSSGGLRSCRIFTGAVRTGIWIFPAPTVPLLRSVWVLLVSFCFYLGFRFLGLIYASIL